MLQSFCKPFSRTSKFLYHQGNDNYTGTAARDAANALSNLTGAVRGVAATTEERDLQNGIIDQAIDVMDKSANLIEEAKRVVNNPDHPDCKARLAQVSWFHL